MSYCRRGENQPWYIYSTETGLILDYNAETLGNHIFSEAEIYTLRNACTEFLRDKEEDRKQKKRNEESIKAVEAAVAESKKEQAPESWKVWQNLIEASKQMQRERDELLAKAEALIAANWSDWNEVSVYAAKEALKAAVERMREGKA